MPNTISLKGLGTRKEAAADVAVTPGYLLEFGATGVQPHSSAGTDAAAAFAVENDIAGKGIDDDYAIADQVLYSVFTPGDEVYGLVAAAAAAIVKGDFLESAGDGTLRKHTAQAVVEGGAATYTISSKAIVARAIEAVDNSAGAAEARIQIEIV